MEYPKFKYVEDGKDVIKYSKEKLICQCCGKSTNFFTDFIYSELDIDVICADCVKSGLACATFQGFFNNTKKIRNIDAVNEITFRTPVLPSYQEFLWPDCCKDMCKYLRRLSKNNLKDEKIMKDVQETFKDEFVSFEELKTFPSDNLLLFQCLHCGKHHVILDLD